MHYKNYSSRYNNYSYMRSSLLCYTTANVYILIVFVLSLRFPLCRCLVYSRSATRVHSRILPVFTTAPCTQSAACGHQTSVSTLDQVSLLARLLSIIITAGVPVGIPNTYF